MNIRVYYEDTDCGNVVYYANYLKYMERGRTELLRERGIDLADYHAKGLLFVVVEAHVKYRTPARYNDLLTVNTSVDDVGPVSIRFSTNISRGSTLLVEGVVRVACVTAAGRPTRIPSEMLAVLSRNPEKHQSGAAS